LRNEVYGHTKPSGVHKVRDDTPAVYKSDMLLTVCTLSSDKYHKSHKKNQQDATV